MNKVRPADLEVLGKALEERTVLPAIVGEENSQGHLVTVLGVTAFLPNARKVFGETIFKGDQVDVCIIKLPEKKHLAIVSTKEASQVKANELIKKYSVGDIVHVRVTSLASYGVFCQIEEGLIGLIYYKELTYSRHQSDIKSFAVGDEFDAKVISIYEKKGDFHIALSRRALLPNPWENLSLSVGDVFNGEVRKKTSFGFFISTPELFDVLLHRTRLGSTKQENQELMKTIDVGDKLTVRVEGIDLENEKMEVSLVSIKEKHQEE